MTLERVKQYIALGKEAKLWQTELQKADTLSQRHKIEERLKQIQWERREIEDFIKSLPNSQLRQILYLRFVKGYSWTKTALSLNRNSTEDAIKKQVYRFFRRIL